MNDLHFALRSLLKSPGFTAVAVLTLALGIGANTATFSVVDTVLLRPLAFPDSAQLVAVWEKTRMFGMLHSPPAMGNYVDWRARNRTFAEMGALEYDMALLTNGGQAEEVWRGVVTASLFRTLQVRPLAGRVWTEGEDLAGSPKTVVLSHALWQQRFGGDPAVVGQTMLMNGDTFTVLGVMPQGFVFPDARIKLWVPMGSRFDASTWQNRGRHNLMVVGRLKPETTLAQANADLQSIAQSLEKDHPDSNADVGAFATSLREHVAGPVRPLYLVLFGAVGLLLLTACANLANLMLARMARRGSETAVRIALGATRWHILRQSLLESGLIGLLGGGLGLLLALWEMDLIRPLVPAQFAPFAPLALDLRVFGFALVSTSIASLLVGCAPLVQMSPTNFLENLKQGGARAGLSVGGGKFQSLLVVAQLALSLTLLTGAGLLLKTFARLHAASLGFQSQGIVLAQLSHPALASKTNEARWHFYRQALERIRALPGVAAVGFTNGAPLVIKGNMCSVHAERPLPNATSADWHNTANYRVVSPDYLKTLGVPLQRGRHLAETDTADAPPVALVNQAFARKFWPDLADPVGQRYKPMFTDGPWYTVVGVVTDMRQSGAESPAAPEMYLSCYQRKHAAYHLVVRTTGDPGVLAPVLRQELAALDPTLPIVELSTMDDVVAGDISPRRLQTTMLGTFAGIALLVAALGLYGVVAGAVVRRTREFGVRAALGARPADIVAHVLRGNLRLLLPGLALGLLIAFTLTKLMAGVLYGVTPHDPVTFTAAACLLLGIALFACWLPARRASKVNPVEALRAE